MAATLWLKIDLGARGQIGPGKIRLLKAIGEHRSISAAARATGMSYRRAWVLVDALNGTLAEPVIATHVGGHGRGGAVLTPAGERLIALFEQVQATAEEATRPLLATIAGVDD